MPAGAKQSAGFDHLPRHRGISFRSGAVKSMQLICAQPRVTRKLHVPQARPHVGDEYSDSAVAVLMLPEAADCRTCRLQLPSCGLVSVSSSQVRVLSRD